MRPLPGNQLSPKQPAKNPRSTKMSRKHVASNLCCSWKITLKSILIHLDVHYFIRNIISFQRKLFDKKFVSVRLPDIRLVKI